MHSTSESKPFIDEHTKQSGDQESCVQLQLGLGIMSFCSHSWYEDVRLIIAQASPCHHYMHIVSAVLTNLCLSSASVLSEHWQGIIRPTIISGA